MTAGELKYCECCGALMVRYTCSGETYCEACQQLLLNAALPIEALRALLRKRKTCVPRAGPPPLKIVAGPQSGVGRQP